ncbi:MAG: hypothetical protein JNK65_05495 [Deltaproteobacteria bacterium]|nr:hypothetical protein [Deltaproteobacteria bacterium]
MLSLKGLGFGGDLVIRFKISNAEGPSQTSLKVPHQKSLIQNQILNGWRRLKKLLGL